MKAKTILLTNGTEIDQASKLGLEIPELKYRDADFYFDITKVTLFFINDDGEINISIDGDMWTLYHTEELWKALEYQVEGNSNSKLD